MSALAMPASSEFGSTSMTFSIIFTFTDFQLVYAITRGGPVNSTHLLATLAFQRKFGQACALQPEDPGESPSCHSRREAQQLRLKEKARRMRFMQYRGFLPEHFRHLLED